MATFKQRGFLLIGTIVLMIVGSLMAGSIAQIFVMNAKSSVSHVETTSALYIADAGLQRAVHELLSSSATLGVGCDTITGNANFTNVAFGDGRFTVTATSYISQPTASLVQGGVNATATIIPISNAGYTYAPEGRVAIDNELIDYSGVGQGVSGCGSNMPRCLLNAKRGQGGTVAAAHSSGSKVEQNICYLESTGVIPDFTNPTAVRKVSGSVPATGIGVAVGRVPQHGDQDDAPTYLKWTLSNQLTRLCPKPLNCSLGLTAPLARMYDASMVNSAYGWAVGATLNTGTPTITFWDGSTWTLGNIDTSTSNSVPDVDFFGVDCTSATNCWAVGEKVIAHWNGTIWQDAGYTPASAVSDSIQFRDVVCTSASNCWAVGTQGSSYTGANRRFYENDEPGSSGPSLISPTTGRSPIYRYNGTEWKSCADATANCPFSGTDPNVHLFGITCVNANHCWAVGTNKAFLHWNGSNWSHTYTLQAGTLLVPAQPVPFYSVSCTATNNCWAVGSGEGSSGSALIAEWNGTGWYRNGNHPTNVSNWVGFFGVVCLAANNCWAVGQQSGGWATYVNYNGTTWSRVGSADFSANSGVPNADLYGIEYVGGFGPPELIHWRELNE